MNLRRTTIATAALALTSLALVMPAQAVTDTGTPSQAEIDGASASSAQMATWKDYSGGVASRPFVTELSATTNGVTTNYITGATAPGQQYPIDGQLTAIITPTNLCQSGQTNNCYTTPNRIGVALALQSNGNANMNLGATNAFTSDTVIDMTINMNSFGSSLRWTWMNGNLQYWQTSGIGAANALIHVKLKPSTTPFISGNNRAAEGCTATPITSCDVTQADADILGASMVLSVDTTMSEALTGAAFATQSAIFGYLEPGGDATSPVLDLQIASSHTMATGAPQIGTLQAILPSNTLLNLYGVQPADASTFFATTRTGSTGTNGTPTYDVWSAATQGTDGLLITVPQISFSVPVYNVARTSTPAQVTATVKGAKATLKIKRPKSCKSSKAKLCTATVYLAANDFSGSPTKAKTVKLTKSSTLAKIKRGSSANYSVTIRKKKGGKLVTTAAGSFLLQ